MVATALLAEDDPKTAELLAKYLRREGINVITCDDGTEALDRTRADDPDILILNVMLPEHDGLEICRRLRDEGCDVPIILLTARDHEAERILGLELGADDYVTKPFSPRELVARVRAKLRRRRSRNRTEILEPLPGLIIDRTAQTVIREGIHLNLSPKEYALFTTLVENPGRVFRRQELLDRLWGPDYDGTERTIDTHIKNLRDKLGQSYSRTIDTVWGVGYQFRGSF